MSVISHECGHRKYSNGKCFALNLCHREFLLVNFDCCLALPHDNSLLTSFCIVFRCEFESMPSMDGTIQFERALNLYFMHWNRASAARPAQQPSLFIEVSVRTIRKEKKKKTEKWTSAINMIARLFVLCSAKFRNAFWVRASFARNLNCEYRLSSACLVYRSKQMNERWERETNKKVRRKITRGHNEKMDCRRSFVGQNVVAMQVAMHKVLIETGDGVAQLV